MLTTTQRAYLKKLIQKEPAIYQVGKKGLSQNQIQQLNDALEARELIKITVLSNSPEDKESIAEQITSMTNSELVSILGSKIVIYKESTKNKTIVLPK